MSHEARYPWKLFLDDHREPGGYDPEWRIARDFWQARSFVGNYGVPYYLQLDHDLGDLENGLTGYDFVNWFISYLDVNKIDWIINYNVHSQNPVGRDNIVRAFESYAYQQQLKKDQADR